MEYSDKICLYCKKSFNRKKRKDGLLTRPSIYKIQKFCSQKCAKSSRIKPEGSKRKDGYVRVTIDGERRYLHRHVAEQKLGRKLRKKEHVHHIDGDKSNNHPDNLEIIEGTKHARYHYSQKLRDERGQFIC